MSGQRQRPWWASSPGIDDLDPDEDPVEVARESRRPRDLDEPPAPSTQTDRNVADVSGGPSTVPPTRTGRQEASDPARQTAEETPPGEHQHGGPTQSRCGFPCPVCTGWRTLADHHPEVVEHLAAAARHVADIRPDVAAHLTAAGHHLLAALRAVLEDVASEERPDDSSFERIDLDDDPGGRS